MNKEEKEKFLKQIKKTLSKTGLWGAINEYIIKLTQEEKITIDN